MPCVYVETESHGPIPVVLFAMARIWNSKSHLLNFIFFKSKILIIKLTSVDKENK